MKGRAFILIFLFFILILNPVSAIDNGDGTGQFTSSGTIVDEYHMDSGNTIEKYPVTQIAFNDIDTAAGVSIVKCRIPASVWDGGDDISMWGEVDYRVGSPTGEIVATGTFGYNKGYPDYYAIAFFDEDTDLTNGGTYSGSQIIYITGNVMPVQTKSAGSSTYYLPYLDYAVDVVTPTLAYMTTGALPNNCVISAPAGLDHETTIIYTFENTYTYTQTYNSFDFTLEKSEVSLSSVIIENNGGHEIINETSLNYVDINLQDWDLTNITWDVQLTNAYSTIFTDTISFALAPIGTINFNQSFYTDPEHIEIDWGIDNFNSDSYVYEIQVITSISGDSSQDSWPADGNWNVSSYVLSASGAAVFDFYSDGYDLPIWVQGELWAQDKSTGTWTRLDSTSVVLYHEAALEAGKVWTDKESYNVTEIVTIYTDTVDGGYLMIDKRNDPLYDSYNIYSGLSHIKFSLQTSHVGTWDVYLYENSVITNSTVFTVLADNDTVYFSWWGDVQKGEAAYYDYVATSSNSVISIYDGIGEKQYSFNATPGYNEGQILTMPGAAGNWTGSLYDGGVYYNSSLEVYASESWIRFEDDMYYMGDTIRIEYFIVDPEYKIRLRDGLCQYGGRSTILTWMPGSFHTGQRGTLEFTLSNDNEFGLQVETNFESGLYLPGTWEIEASGMTETGYGSVDDTTYVHGKVKESIGDPADISNEMISLFFSPEGIYLLFTACLTLAGLASTKHPGGGAVCAVVGVGFGVFFKVLPVWMLLLMVITLVVLAGVSVAVYFKGK